MGWSFSSGKGLNAKEVRRNCLQLNFQHDGGQLVLSGTSAADQAWENCGDATLINNC